MDLKEEQAIGCDPASHWYYIAKGRAIGALVGAGRYPSVLDVGAGSGVFSRMLLREGRATRAVCVDPNYTDEHLAAHQEGPIRYARSIVHTDAQLILMIDVIEHVDDDVALIAQYARMARPGAKFLVAAPAFDFLWSSHDDFLEHRRRYTLKALEASVVAAGLVPRRLRYFFGVLFPAVAAMRLIDRLLSGVEEASEGALRSAPTWLTKALVTLHDIERATLFKVNNVVGVTAFCLAEKPLTVASAARAA